MYWYQKNKGPLILYDFRVLKLQNKGAHCNENGISIYFEKFFFISGKVDLNEFKVQQRL